MITLYGVLKSSLLSLMTLCIFTYGNNEIIHIKTPTPIDKNDANDTNHTFTLPPGEHAIIDLGNPDKNNCIDITHFHRYPNYTHVMTLKGSFPLKTWNIEYSNWSKEYNSTQEHQNYHFRSTSYSGGKFEGRSVMDVDMTVTFTLNTRNIMPLREITKRVADPLNSTYTSADGRVTNTYAGPGIITYSPYSLFPTKLCQGASISETYYSNVNGSHGTKQVSRLDVVEIGVRKCVKAGCFDTVHLHYVSTSPVDLEGDRWMDLKTGVLVYSNHTSQEMELISIDK